MMEVVKCINCNRAYFDYGVDNCPFCDALQVPKNEDIDNIFRTFDMGEFNQIFRDKK